MRKTYQGTGSKSKQKFEVMGNGKLLVEMPLPMVEVWEELQAQVEQLTGHAGLQIIGTIQAAAFRPSSRTNCSPVEGSASMLKLLRTIWPSCGEASDAVRSS